MMIPMRREQVCIVKAIVRINLGRQAQEPKLFQKNCEDVENFVKSCTADCTGAAGCHGCVIIYPRNQGGRQQTQQD